MGRLQMDDHTAVPGDVGRSLGQLLLAMGARSGACVDRLGWPIAHPI